MKPTLLAGALAAAAAAAPLAHAAHLPDGLTPQARAQAQAADIEAVARAIVNAEVAVGKRSAPSGSYAPSYIPCPQLNTTGGNYTGRVRSAQGFAISPREADYIRAHRQARHADWTTWLKQAQVGLDSLVPGGFDNYTSDLSRVPKVGIASSGGGYRAMLNGAGVFAAFDGRNDTANAIGTGGLLQLADYISGLSGGSWLTGSVAINDYPTTQQLHDQVWDLSSNLVIPEHGKISFYTGLISDVKAKKDFVGNGDWTGITDYWARALAHHLINGTMYPSNGVATTWSDVRNVSNFQSHAYPFPIIIADEREPGTLLIEGDSAIWEFTPYEYGAWEKVQGFIDIELLGTAMTNGQPSNDSQCVAGWENAAYIMGASSTLFNGAYSQLITSKGSSIIKKAIEAILGDVSEYGNDVTFVPNSFGGLNPSTSAVVDTNNVTHVDGGEDGQNVPVWPLINPGRGLDFVIAEDSSADASSWPNGTSLWTTSQRFNASDAGEFKGYAFPYVPPMTTFVNRGLNTRPTFFGCPGSRITNENSSHSGQPTPIVAYLPNYPYAGWGNTSTFKLDYSSSESQTVLDNAFHVATMGNATSGDINWPTCLACGLLTRSFERSNTPIPDKCQTCLKAYCWDGVEDNTPNPQEYSPPIGTPVFITSNGRNLTEPPFTGGSGSAGASDNPAATTSPTSSKASIAVAIAGVALAALL